MPRTETCLLLGEATGLGHAELESTVRYLHVEVDDSGPGVAPADRGRVLERGWSSKAQEGRGLGLAMVAQVVSRHDGTLDVTESPLGGARFVVGVRSPVPQPADRAAT